MFFNQTYKKSEEIIFKKIYIFCVVSIRQRISECPKFNEYKYIMMQTTTVKTRQLGFWMRLKLISKLCSMLIRQLGDIHGHSEITQFRIAIIANAIRIVLRVYQVTHVLLTYYAIHRMNFMRCRFISFN